MIDLTKSTFCVPYQEDSIERKQNLELVIEFIKGNFNTNIIILNTSKNEIHFDDVKIVHQPTTLDYYCISQTKNELARLATTPVIILQDCDIICDPMNYKICEDEIINNGAVVCSPYNSTMYQVPRKEINLDVSKIDVNRCKIKSRSCCGGLIVFDRIAFYKYGGFSEVFKDYGYEDLELFFRLLKLCRIMRVQKPCFHFEHPTKPLNLLLNHRWSDESRNELKRVRSMTKKEVKEYVVELSKNFTLQLSHQP